MWGSPAPVQTEAEEVEGLKQMFAPCAAGRDPDGLGTYMKLSVANENRRIADKGREEKRELDALLEQRRIEQAERIRQLKAQRGEKDQEAIEERFREKNAIANEMRMLEKQRLAERNEQRRQFLKEAKDRVNEAKERQEYIRQKEKDDDEADREEQAQLRAARQRAQAAENARQNEWKARLGAQTRAAHEGCRRSLQSSLSHKQGLVAEAMREHEELKRERAEIMAAQAEKNRQQKEAQMQARERARRAKIAREKSLQKSASRASAEYDAILRQTRGAQSAKNLRMRNARARARTSPPTPSASLARAAPSSRSCTCRRRSARPSSKKRTPSCRRVWRRWCRGPTTTSPMRRSASRGWRRRRRAGRARRPRRSASERRTQR